MQGVVVLNYVTVDLQQFPSFNLHAKTSLISKDFSEVFGEKSSGSWMCSGLLHSSKHIMKMH